MKNNKGNKGFTLVEIIIAIVLMGTLISITLSKFNFSSKISDNISTDLMSSFNTIEASYGNYLNDKNVSPTGLNDASFVPIYLMIPQVPTGFDTAYGGTGGFILTQQTGQASPNNGWYISTLVNVSDASDAKWDAIVKTANKLPATKFNYNTGAAAVSNMGAPGGSTNVYVTYWITRY